MKNFIRTLAIGACAFAACSEIKNTPYPSTPLTNALFIQTVSEGMTGLGDTADDQAQENLLSKNRDLLDFLIPNAYAAPCSGTAGGQVCNAGQKVKTYSACDIPGTTLELNGTVSLDYSNATCDLTSTGDSVTRTYILTREAVIGGTVNLTTADHQDYRGNIIGGGGRLTKANGTQWTLDVLGSHRMHSSLWDISLRTTSPLSIQNTLSRNGRMINGGALEVIHNQAKFTATWVPNQLQYTANCCYPISGSMGVQYDGTVHGSGTITFLECAKALLHNNNNNEEITVPLQSCI